MKLLLMACAATLSAATLIGCSSEEPGRGSGEGGAGGGELEPAEFLAAIAGRIGAAESLAIRLDDGESEVLLRMIEGKEEGELFFVEDLGPLIEAAVMTDQHQPGQEFIGFVRHSPDRLVRAWMAFWPDGRIYAHGGGAADATFGKEPWRNW